MPGTERSMNSEPTGVNDTVAPRRPSLRDIMRGLPGTLLLLFAAGSLHAAERGPWSEVQSDAIRSHVEFLAADLLEGRATASRGYDIAAAYVTSQFRQAGLQPAGD